MLFLYPFLNHKLPHFHSPKKPWGHKNWTVLKRILSLRFPFFSGQMWNNSIDSHLGTDSINCIKHRNIYCSRLQTSTHNVRVHWWHTGEERRLPSEPSRTLRPTTSCVTWRKSKTHHEDARTHPENLTTNRSASPSQPASCRLSCRERAALLEAT